MSVHKFCHLLIYYCVVFSYYCKKNLNSFIYLIVINSCILFLGIVSVIVFGETKFVEEACRTEKKMTLVTADNCGIPTSFSPPFGASCNTQMYRICLRKSVGLVDTNGGIGMFLSKIIL